jgi:coenzyme PQQ biosynthesis protein PqqD
VSNTSSDPSPRREPVADAEHQSTLGPDSRPRLWRLARLEYDPVRQRQVLLYPEGAILLNDTGAEILALCDGTRTLAEISGTLGAKYQADVANDVTAYLARLMERELVQDAADRARL